MDELIKDFLQESTENLDRLDQDFVKLESEPDNPELLKSIFRTIHTIKGTCGFLGFTKLEALTHAGESLLSLLRDGEIRLTENSADTLLEMVDAVRRYLHEIEAAGREGGTDTSDLITRLKKLQERTTKSEGAVTPGPAPSADGSAQVTEAKKIAAPCTTQKRKPTAEPATGTATPNTERPTQENLKQEPLPKSPAGALAQKSNGRPEDVRQTKPEETKDAAIRVDVNLLEKQMNLVSQLVLLRNRLL